MNDKMVFRVKPGEFSASITNSGIHYNNKLEIELNNFRIPDIYGVHPHIDSSAFRHCDEIQITIEPAYNRPRLKRKTEESVTFDECIADWFAYDKTEHKIQLIEKVIVNGPATIIIDKLGQKTIVKYDGEPEKRDPILGFGVCLLKYILDKKKYSDAIDCIFGYDNRIDRMIAVEAMLISHMGSKLYYEHCIGCLLNWAFEDARKRG